MRAVLEARDDNTKAVNKDNLEDENEATFTRSSKATSASTAITKRDLNLKPAFVFIFFIHLTSIYFLFVCILIILGWHLALNGTANTITGLAGTSFLLL